MSRGNDVGGCRCLSRTAGASAMHLRVATCVAAVQPVKISGGSALKMVLEMLGLVAPAKYCSMSTLLPLAEGGGGGLAIPTRVGSDH